MKNVEPQEVFFKDGLHLIYPNNEQYVIPYFTLRMTCPCAVCVDEITGARKVDAKSIDPKIHVLDCEYVGNYGIKIIWSDQHATGIYPYAYLKALCYDLYKLKAPKDKQ